MRKHGKPAALVTCLAIVSLAFLGGSARGDYNTTPGVLSEGDLAGVRLTAFNNSNTSSWDLRVGIPPLVTGSSGVHYLSFPDLRGGVPDGWLVGNGCNRLEVMFASGTLAVGIGHATSCDETAAENWHWHQAGFENLPGFLQESDRSFFDAGLNVMQINIKNVTPGSNISLKNLEWAGVYPFGTFSSDGTNSLVWSVTGNYGPSKFLGPASSITLTADLELSGTFSPDPELESYVEILFGHYTPPNLPPDCINPTVNIDKLWPPSGEFWEVAISVYDGDGDSTSVTVNSITQDEPVCDSAGPCQPDGAIGGGLAKLRAKRNPVGNGRVYYINFTADDGRGGTCTGTATVGVPKNKGKNGIPVGEGELYNSLVAAP